MKACNLVMCLRFTSSQAENWDGIHTCAFDLKNILNCLHNTIYYNTQVTWCLQFNQFWPTKWQFHMSRPNASVGPQHIFHLTYRLELNFLYWCHKIIQKDMQVSMIVLEDFSSIPLFFFFFCGKIPWEPDWSDLNDSYITWYFSNNFEINLSIFYQHFCILTNL